MLDLVVPSRGPVGAALAPTIACGSEAQSPAIEAQPLVRDCVRALLLSGRTLSSNLGLSEEAEVKAGAE